MRAGALPLLALCLVPGSSLAAQGWGESDDEYLYASGRFYDSRPAEIRVNSLYRDRWSGDDTFHLFVDGFNDNETGSAGSEPSSAV